MMIFSRWAKKYTQTRPHKWTLSDTECPRQCFLVMHTVHCFINCSKPKNMCVCWCVTHRWCHCLCFPAWSWGCSRPVLELQQGEWSRDCRLEEMLCCWSEWSMDSSWRSPQHPEHTTHSSYWLSPHVSTKPNLTPPAQESMAQTLGYRFLATWGRQGFHL